MARKWSPAVMGAKRGFVGERSPSSPGATIGSMRASSRGPVKKTCHRRGGSGARHEWCGRGLTVVTERVERLPRRALLP